MTVSQAHRLADYTRSLGYQAEVVLTWRGKHWATDGSPVALRLRRGTELWWWLFARRQWRATIRQFRALDRAEGVRRP